MLTNTIDYWVSLLIKLTLYVKVGCSTLTDEHSVVLGTEVGYLWLTLFRLWWMLRWVHGCSDRFRAL